MNFKIFNLIFYMSFAAKSYFNIYFSDIGFSSTQIGIINSIARGVSMFILPLWGMFADSFNAGKRVLQIAIAGSIIVTLSFLTTESYLLIIGLMVLYSVFHNPIRPLYDSLLFGYLGKAGNQYGRYRLWGSVGYTLMVPLLGFYFQKTGSRNAFLVLASLLLFVLLVSNRLPEAKNKSSKNQKQGRFSHFSEVLKNKHFISFLFFVFFMQITMNANLTYFPLYVLEYGGREGLFGLAKMVGSISEILILLLSHKILERYRLSDIFLVSSLSFALRWLILGLFPGKYVFLISQLLHSLSFGLFYVICVNYVNRITREEYKTTAQNLFTSTYLGLGSIFGNLVGGVLFENLGGNIMYLIWFAVALAAGLIYYFNMNKKASQNL